MKTINRYIQSNYLQDKSVKSLWNLLKGARTQQTYFDAAMQNMLPVYELYPKVSIQAVEKLVKQKNDEQSHLHLYPYFYYASEIGFLGFVLLLQTISEYLHHSTTYLPSTNRLFIQHHVKQLFIQIKTQDLFIDVAQEVERITQRVEKETGHCIFIHLLYGHDIAPSSTEHIAKQYNMTKDEVESQLFIEKNLILHLFKSEQLPILHQLYVRAPLHLNTQDTYQRIIQGNTVEQITQQKGVRIHTVQDHIIEMIIKDYPIDTSIYLSDVEYETMLKVLQQHRFGKLKAYYELSPIKDYFKLKLAIVKYHLECR
ncbi:helix-turn-helix domain-containing protein [Macrococcus capreoli]|uniref:helix-turn-helix domain-containing protein n=1 Tax=Macrococcus capreoli TaxID=2982690 RepID=UPI0021D5C141|nr:helix-turn-helix domain-containing protein [Macrococcus sp. TMW 2.2395]MCU7556776.1 helix-turn-helix domain-containing protein [Macrococcus sp. TMW 2.2395]